MQSFLEDLSKVPAWAYGVRRVVVLSGAGISTDSGIPDFRGPSGAWTLHPNAQHTNTYDAFLRDADLRRSYWKSRAEHEVWRAEPNAAHLAVAKLAESGLDVTVVTQNTDGLHQQAGMAADRVIELHGTMRETLCVRCDHRMPTADVILRVETGEPDPLCLRCGGILKTASTMFGQTIAPEVFAGARDAVTSCDLILAVGTSLVIEPPASLCASGVRAGATLVIVNQGATPYDGLAAAVIAQPLGTALPRIGAQLLQAARIDEQPAGGGAPARPATPATPLVRPSQLLRASARIATFRARAAELDGLNAWCADNTNSRVSALLLSGPAGAGKTRLALELTHRLTSAGRWRIEFFPGEAPLSPTEGPLLVIVEDAEAWQQGVARLLGAARDRTTGPPVRVLLLARKRGEWWDRLCSPSDSEMNLTPLPAEEGDGTAVNVETIRAYTAALTSLGIVAAASPEQASTSRLARNAQTPGIVQAGILAVLLGVDTDEMSGLVNHEVVYLAQVAAEHGLVVDAETAAAAAVVAILCGAADEEDAQSVLGSVPGLDDVLTRSRAVRWLRELYPPASPARPELWDTSLPDPLEEDLIAATATPQFLLKVLSDTTEKQDRRALTVLSRAAETRPLLQERLTELLTLLPGLSPSAVDVALGCGHPAPLVDALTALAGSVALPVDLLYRVPAGTTALGLFPVVLTQSMVKAYEFRQRTDYGLRGLTGMLIELADRLGDVGRPEESLAAARRAVEAAQRLAKPLDHTDRAAECLRRASARATQ